MSPSKPCPLPQFASWRALCNLTAVAATTGDPPMRERIAPIESAMSPPKAVLGLVDCFGTGKEIVAECSAVLDFESFFVMEIDKVKFPSEKVGDVVGRRELETETLETLSENESETDFDSEVVLDSEGVEVNERVLVKVEETVFELVAVDVSEIVKVLE